MIYISTTSTTDLAEGGSDQFFLSPLSADDVPDWELESLAVSRLAYPYRWHLDCRFGGCSCHFRHAYEEGTSPLRFRPPDSSDEDDEGDIRSTAAVYDLLREIVALGERIDLVDVSGASRGTMSSITVSFSEVQREFFRFFDNHRFDFVP